MKLFAPKYYKQFKCVADKCTHSCCIGWEIDIDEITLKKYESLSEGYGKEIINTVENGETAHFKLCEDERCPHLDCKGLCRIISEVGENYLCDICREHPRFYNDTARGKFVGLGMACEEAARIILTHPDKTSLINLGDATAVTVNSEEKAILRLRSELFDILQDRKISINDRFKKIEKRCSFQLPAPFQVQSILRKTERMDPTFNDLLIDLNGDFWPIFDKKWQTPLEQLAVYFLFRHLPDAMEDGYLRERIAFSLLSAFSIGAIAQKNSLTTDTLIDTARQYSAEIEYSDQNTQEILSSLNLG